MDNTRQHTRTAVRLATLAVGASLLASCANGAGAAGPVDPSESLVAAAAATYTVAAGDTLSGIAQRAGVLLSDLVKVNGWPDGSGHLILPGDEIALPSGATTPSPPFDEADVVSTTGSDTTPNTSPAPATSPIDENGWLACDSAAIIAAIGDPTFVTFDEVGCENGWAGAGYIDSDNFYNPVILKAEGGRWVLQDRSTVCDDYLDMPYQAQLYCPGG